MQTISRQNAHAILVKTDPQAWSLMSTQIKGEILDLIFTGASQQTHGERPILIRPMDTCLLAPSAAEEIRSLPQEAWTLWAFKDHHWLLEGYSNASFDDLSDRFLALVDEGMMTEIMIVPPGQDVPGEFAPLLLEAHLAQRTTAAQS